MKYLFLTLCFLLAGAAAPPTQMATDVNSGLFFYKIKLNSVYDGDTIHADVNLGFGVWLHNEGIRLAGLNAPEITGPTKPEGQATRKVLAQIVEGNELLIQTGKDEREKYGRILANVWVKGSSFGTCNPLEWCSVNQQLIAAGYAATKKY
jgi:micrococcal nuclease